MEKSPEQIVFKIQQIASLYPAMHEVSYILDDFKKHMDFTKLYHALSNYEENVILAEIDITEEGIDADGIKRNDDHFVDFVSIYGFDTSVSIKVRDLHSLGTFSLWSDDFGKDVFGIIINKTKADKTPMLHTNMEVLFMTEEERDLELKRLKLKLFKFSDIRFL